MRRDQAYPDPLNVTVDPCRLGVLRHMRLDAGMSIREMSEATGINRGRVSIIERGATATEAEIHALLDAIYWYRDAFMPPNRLRRRHDALPANG